MLSDSKRKAQFIVLTTFLLGAFTGGLATYIVQNQQSQRSNSVAAVVTRIDERIGLQPEQRFPIESILQDSRQRYRELKEQTRPQYDAVRQSARAKIRSLLSAEQQTRFDEYVKELDAERAARQAEAAK